MPGWPKFARAVECADREMRLGRQPRAFTGQCRSATGAEPAAGSSGRGVEFCDFTFGDHVSRMFECHKNRSRRTAMLAATLAMAPINSLRLTSRRKTDGAAQAAAFELVGRASHKSDPPATRRWSSRRSSVSLYLVATNWAPDRRSSPSQQLRRDHVRLKKRLALSHRSRLRVSGVRLVQARMLSIELGNWHSEWG